MDHSRSRRSVVLALCLYAVSMAGCKSWQEVRLTPEDLAAVRLPAKMRVTQSGLSEVVRVIEIHTPNERGVTGAYLLIDRTREPIRVFLHDIELLESRQFSGWRSSALITGGVVVMGAVLVVIVVSAIKSAY